MAPLQSFISVLLAFIALLTFASASPVPDQSLQVDLGFKGPSPHQTPRELPLKLYVHAGRTCSGRTHLYYLPENRCIGPLYHPGGSFKMISTLPKGCVVRGFQDGHCNRGESGSDNVQYGIGVRIGGFADGELKGERKGDRNVCMAMGGNDKGNIVNSLRVECS